MVKVRAGQSDHIHQQLLEFFISKDFFQFFFFDSALEWESRPCGTNGWMSRILFILFRSAAPSGLDVRPMADTDAALDGEKK